MSTTAHLSLAEYDRIVATGVFDHPKRRRMELINGEIREMNPIGPMHEDAVDLLSEWSFDRVPRGKVRVRVQNSIGLPALDSAPEPDVAWVRRRRYSRRRPTAADVLLVIEVADTSLDYDTGEKAALYAAEGIQDYWVVNLPEQCVEVRRDPTGGRYQTLSRHSGDDEVRPLAVPEVALSPSLLRPE